MYQPKVRNPLSPLESDQSEGVDEAMWNLFVAIGDFNSRYTTMLLQLSEAKNGSPKSLYTAIMNGMHGLTSLAHAMMKIPILGDRQNRFGCPTFERKT
jgi:hypothetical protein